MKRVTELTDEQVQQEEYGAINIKSKKVDSTREKAGALTKKIIEQEKNKSTSNCWTNKGIFGPSEIFI